MPAPADTPAPPLTGPLVVALVYDGLCTFEFSIVAEVFGLPRPEMGTGWYRFASAAIEDGPLRAHGGLRVQADAGVDLLEQADLIVIPGWKGVDVPVPDSLTQPLRRAWARGARLASICSGAFVLAATGLLDGRRATTHWRYADQLAQRHPAIEVDAKVLYVEGDRLLTSAGSAAGMDLMLHIVRQDFGLEAANRVARRLVMPTHRQGGQAQFIERPVPPDKHGRPAHLLDTLQADLTQPWTVEHMAARLAMSPRTFLRHFKAATGCTPGIWLDAARLQEARRLLESTALPIEQVAEQAGFGTVQALRRQFRQTQGVSPRDFRRAFSSTDANTAR